MGYWRSRLIDATKLLSADRDDFIVRCGLLVPENDVGCEGPKRPGTFTGDVDALDAERASGQALSKHQPDRVLEIVTIHDQADLRSIGLRDDVDGVSIGLKHLRLVGELALQTRLSEIGQTVPSER